MADSQSIDSKRKYGEYVTEIDGKKYAVVRIPLGGGKYKKKVKLLSLIGGTKSHARKWAWGELDQGNVECETFRQLANWYRDDFLIAPEYQDGRRLYGLRTWKHQRVVLERLCRYFGDYQIQKITVDVLNRYKREKLKGSSIAAVNRDFALMRTMFLKAKRRRWITESPFESGEGLIEMSLEQHRTSKINSRIVKRLLARSRKSEQPLLHYLIYVLAYTGARPSEIFPYNAREDGVPREPLIWARVLESDFETVRLVSYKGRIREERLVPTSPGLESALRRLYAQVKPTPEDVMFPVHNFKRSWKTLCRSARVKDVWMRDLRKYFNTEMMMNPNISDMERMLLMGQRDMNTNRRYSKLDESFIEKYRRVIS